MWQLGLQRLEIIAEVIKINIEKSQKGRSSKDQPPLLDIQQKFKNLLSYSLWLLHLYMGCVLYTRHVMDIHSCTVDIDSSMPSNCHSCTRAVHKLVVIH